MAENKLLTDIEVKEIFDKYNVYDLNNELGRIYQKSARKLNAECPACSTKFSTIISSLLHSKRKCPYCANRIVQQGVNDLASRHPELLTEWDYEKNNQSPDQVAPKSNKQAWWLCQLKHSYQQKIEKHVGGQGCPYCAGRKVLSGFNNITDENLTKEWDHVNNSKTIHEYTRGSNHSAQWICEENHSFKATIINRIQRKDGCPYCSGRKVLNGYNDLRTMFPEILEEWVDVKNNHLDIDVISWKTTKQAWFKCSECKHEWKTSIYNRSILKTGCPRCSYSITVSKSEKEFVEFLEKRYPEHLFSLNTRNVIPPMEIDVHAPKLKLGIEFNGDYWHSEEQIRKSKRMSAFEYHTLKIDEAREAGVTLLMVWENDWKKRPEAIKEAIRQIIELSEKNTMIDVNSIPGILRKAESDIR